MRYSSGITPTDYRYTGQLEQADVNLYYYNARYYDAALGRFVQADTIIPSAGDSKSYDRYTYVNNNPVMYTDPSGHCYADSGIWIPDGLGGACTFKTSNQEKDTTEQLTNFGITTENGNDVQNEAALKAAILDARKLAMAIGNYASPQDTFLEAHGSISIDFEGRSDDMCETNLHNISCGNVESAWFVQTLIHEYGHVFDNQFYEVTGNNYWASSYTENDWDTTFDGYMCSTFPCIQHPYPKTGPRGRVEDFADMYLNWVLDMDIAYPKNGFTSDDWGNKRRDMMNNDEYTEALLRGIPVWLEEMGIR